MVKKSGYSIGWISDNIRKGEQTPHVIKSTLFKINTKQNNTPNACVGHPNFSQDVWNMKYGKKC
jgi:hypothetical protein